MERSDVDRAIAHLRHLTQRDVQTDWRQWRGDLPFEQATDPQQWGDWSPVRLNDRHHIAWDQGKQVLWLGLRLRVPAELAGYPLAGLTLRLSLTWWAENAQVFVDGARVQEGDLFDHSARVVLRQAVQPGEAIAIALRLVSPGHDPGALVRSTCLYERPDYGLEPVPEPGFVADELAVMQQYVQALAPAQAPELSAAVASLDWAGVSDQAAFDGALGRLRDRLLPIGDWIRQRQIFLLGHAHLDLAWLWPVAETWEVAERTFRSVLTLQAEFPELIFSHSSPALYHWLEVNRPELFAAIQQQVAAGRWEVAAGLWVEPEFNTVGGEAIARQILYGQRYVAEKFGKPSAIAWLPDSFGFCAQLPQLLRQGGIRYFVTQKLGWNDTNPFPLEWFWWRSPLERPDGGILSLHCAPIGEGVDPLKMAHYATHWETQTGLTEALWLIGVGDHGGGPTRDMLHLARRWGRSPFFPRLSFAAAETFLDAIAPAHPPADLPVWSDELYLEFHRGCYTTHADQKTWNRQCESGLYAAELWGTLAHHLAHFTYPAQDLEKAWKKVLFNQFHDILPGSAIPQVYEDANPDWAAAAATAERVCGQALGAIAQHLALPNPPIPNAQPLVIFNSLNWERSDIIRLTIPTAPTHGWQIRDLDGTPLPTDYDGTTLTAWVDAIPGIGYKTLWLCDAPPTHPPTHPLPNPPTPSPTLENPSLRIQIAPDTGNLLSLFDKRQQRELLAAPANVLQVFQDQGQYWDAWNIDPDFEQHPLPAAKLIQLDSPSIQAVEQSIRVVRRVGQSDIVQRYVLRGDAPLLWIETEVDWQECHTLLKAAFSVAVESAEFWRDMPFGAIAHPTRPTDPVAKAKWEVPALRWVDLSTETHGLSLLTGIKHGVDVRPGQLRLSLLRSPLYPNPGADRGHHRFTYALAPHTGTWQASDTVRQSRELSQPLLVYPIDERDHPSKTPTLPPESCLFRLHSKNLVVAAVKPAEDDPQQIIVRLYEAHGQPVTEPLDTLLTPAIPGMTTTVSMGDPLLERLSHDTAPPATLHPWEIRTLRLT